MLLSKKYLNIKLLFYIIVSLFYMEIILNLSIFRSFSFINIFLIFIFSTIMGLVFAFFSSLANPKINKAIYIILLVLTGFIFSSQIVYNSIFKVFYTMYSAKNAYQVAEFWREIIIGISNNIFWVILMFIPSIILLLFSIFCKKSISFNRITNKERLFLLIFIIIFHILGIGLINLGNKNPNSLYDLYYNTNYPDLSIKKLGLITTMRLDVQRLAFGWSPSLGTIPEYTKDPSLPTYREDEEEEVIEYNVMEIDFENLISKEENQELLEMHKYFNNVEPTPKNDYTEKYKGYNLILITAEGFSPYAVHKEATPTPVSYTHLSGVRPVGNSTYFFNPSKAAGTWIVQNKTYVVRIGNHVFYQ